MQILYDAVRELLDTFAPSLTLVAHVNDRKIFNAISDYLDLSDDTRKKLLPLLDEYLKLPKDKFEASASEMLGEKKIRFFEIFELTPASASFPSEAIETAYKNIGAVIEELKKS
jgi:histidyl-tRNA synthetase